MHIKWIRTGLVLMLVVISGATAFMLVDTVVAQAQAGQSPGNPWNYTLVQDRFEFNNDSPYILTLQFRGNPILTNTVEWRVAQMPDGVTSASIRRINGQNVLRFTGHVPTSAYSFNIVANVMQDGRQLASVQLVVSVHTA
jgi:hypothetical protein